MQIQIKILVLSHCNCKTKFKMKTKSMPIFFLIAFGRFHQTIKVVCKYNSISFNPRQLPAALKKKKTEIHTTLHKTFVELQALNQNVEMKQNLGGSKNCKKARRVLEWPTVAHCGVVGLYCFCVIMPSCWFKRPRIACVAVFRFCLSTFFSRNFLSCNFTCYNLL